MADTTTTGTTVDRGSDLGRYAFAVRPEISVPTLAIHDDSDATVALEVPGRRAVEQVPDVELAVVAGGPHGPDVSRAEEFNQQLLASIG